MERIKSIIQGRDPLVLKTLLEFYTHPAGQIVDVTCNKRRMWHGLDISNVTFCDIDPLVKPDIICNFKQTPFADNSIALIVFDPPHLPAAASSPKSLGHFVKDFGLNRTVKGDNIEPIFRPFLQEALRILKPDGLIFTKLSDFVHNHKYQWMLNSFVSTVTSMDGLTACDLIIKIDPAAGHLTSSKWVSTYHARRSHCWYVITRKGGCEPKL